MGNGAAIKTGARNATGSILVFMDADGQHTPADITRLLDKFDEGYDMVVGARHLDSHASLARRIGNTIYNKLASWMTGYPIEDLTSGFRAARSRHFKKFLYLLPNKFSYPTTSTMAFFRSGLPVGYVPIKAMNRTSDRKSHIRLFHDGFRFLLIIMKIGALFSPMRFFLPISGTLFLVGITYYAYTYLAWGRLTNMSAILFLSALFTFLIGIVSEQISALHYKDIVETKRRSTRDR
jgi:glycosyltransferase involved in cell wall biosynthesis